MKIEVGKAYRMRNGRKAIVESYNKKGRGDYPFLVRTDMGKVACTADGKFYAYGPAHHFDLILEWSNDTPDPAAEALELLNIDRAQLDALSDRADGKADLNLAIAKVNVGEGQPQAAVNVAPAGFLGKTASSDLMYGSLASVLLDAYEQAATGKGKQRHANGKPFDRQPIMELGRMTGAGGTAFQAMKKIQEACGMLSRGEFEAAERELLGAINYSAATVLLSRELLSREKSRA